MKFLVDNALLPHVGSRAGYLRMTLPDVSNLLKSL
jgi:hypothetical protein